MKSVTLGEIAQLLNVPLASNAGRAVTGMATLDEASPSDLSFLGSDAYLNDFERTNAAAVIVNRRVKLPADHRRNVLVVDDADLAVAKVLELFAPAVPPPAGG